MDSAISAIHLSYNRLQEFRRFSKLKNIQACLYELPDFDIVQAVLLQRKICLPFTRYLVKCCSMLASGQPVSTPTAAYLAAVAKETACTATSPQDFRNPDVLVRAYKHRAARYMH